MATMYNKFFDISKLTLWAEPVSDGEKTKSPQLVFGFRDGNPRIMVYTGAQGPGGVIAFPSDYPTMVGVLQLLKDVIKGKPGEERYAIASLGAVYENDRPTKEKRVVATLHIGKSKEGLVYLSVLAEGKPKIVFPIKSSQYHTWHDGNKAVVPDAVISERIAMGLAELVLNLISNGLMRYSDEVYTSGGRKQAETKPHGSVTTTENKTEIMQDLDDLAL